MSFIPFYANVGDKMIHNGATYSFSCATDTARIQRVFDEVNHFQKVEIMRCEHTNNNRANSGY